VISIDPDFPDAYNLRGLIYMRLNDYPQAEDSFRRAVSLNPKDPNLRHNYGWLQCQERLFDEAQRSFDAALADPMYLGRAKTLMAQGICQARAGKKADAERTLARSYELDAGNPVTGYTLASLLFQRGDFARAQFYIRRLNNTELANAESLWLGIKVERRLDDRVAMRQLAEQLKKRFPQSREATLFEKGAFDE
jgi:type IV pilus assembly protein PilF